LSSKRIAIPRHLTAQDAIQLQNKLAALVSQESAIPERIKYIVGADCSYSNQAAVGAAVLTDYETLKPIETTIVKAQVAFPYIPGLLAFREGPVVIRAIRKLRHRPDVCMVDGHGLAHPRKFGLACYVGVLTNLPTIGVAKSRLFGTDVGEALVDSEGNVIATILQFKERKRLYVSIGHKISLQDATRIAKDCITMRGLEPILLAHQEAKKLRWSPKT
jgi:deoxyribonuclease V